MGKTKKMIEWDIMLAINELSHKIQNGKRCVDDDHRDSESIKLLAEAYDIVHRGKRGD